MFYGLGHGTTKFSVETANVPQKLVLSVRKRKDARGYCPAHRGQSERREGAEDLEHRGGERRERESCWCFLSQLGCNRAALMMAQFDGCEI